MIDRIIFVRVSVLSEFLIFQSNLFHSVITEEKQVFLKKKTKWYFIALPCSL